LRAGPKAGRHKPLPGPPVPLLPRHRLNGPNRVDANRIVRVFKKIRDCHGDWSLSGNERLKAYAGVLWFFLGEAPIAHEIGKTENNR
jgi:hypothetical protein